MQGGESELEQGREQEQAFVKGAEGTEEAPREVLLEV